MPYIKKSDRWLNDGEKFTPARSAGELNYHLTTVIIRYLETHSLCYQTCNDIVGALDNCKDEFRRRVQHPYENQKIAENGDIYITEPEKWSNEECAKCGGYAGGSDGVCLPCALEEKQKP